MTPSWESAISEYLDNALDLGLAVESAKAYGYRLRYAARGLQAESPWTVTARELRDWFDGLGQGASARRGYRTVVRGFYRWGVETGRVAVSPAAGLRRVAPPPPRPRPVPDEVYASALRRAGERERLMLRLAAEHGLRRGEVARVHSDDLWRDLDGWSLTVHGKGGKDRDVPLTALVARRLLERPPGYAFPGGQDGHVSPWWVGRLLSRLLVDDYTAHKLRHRAGSRWYDASGHDVFLVQQLLGHADPRTTRVYVGRDRATMRQVVEAAA
jgi:integrase/recombinase XerC